MGQVDTALGDAADRDLGLSRHNDELWAEAVEHLAEGDSASCEAAISQASELLAVQ